MSTLKIAPSLLAADFADLSGEIKKVESAGCEWLHIDVMDGHFVPNLTVGPFIVKAVRRRTRLFLDTHLMIENPEQFIGPFVQAGSDLITVHAEACGRKLGRVIQAVRKAGVRCGVSLKPATPLNCVKKYLKDLDLVLLMTVNPGFGGQAFIRSVLPKIRNLRKMFDGDIQVDGGINAETAAEAVAAGANVLVAGTAIFGKPNVQQAIQALRQSK